MPNLLYDTGWNTFQQVLTQCVGLILLWMIIGCIKGFRLFLATGSTIFDNCCAKCHSILEQATNFTINVLHTTILPQLSRSNHWMLPWQQQHHYNDKGCVRYANWCFHKEKNCSSGQHAQFHCSTNNKIHHKGRYPYLKLKKKVPPPASKHRWRRKQQSKLVLVHCIDTDKHSNDLDDVDSPGHPPTPSWSCVKKKPPSSRVKQKTNKKLNHFGKTRGQGDGNPLVIYNKFSNFICPDQEIHPFLPAQDRRSGKQKYTCG